MAELRDGDYMKGLVRYCQRNLSRGYTLDQVRLTLLQQGYSKPGVDRAIKLALESMPKPQVIEKKEEPQIQIVEEESVPSRKRTWLQKLLGLNKIQAPSGAPPEF